MAARVAWVSALTGLKVRLPRSFVQISSLISTATGALNPARENNSERARMRGVSESSISANLAGCFALSGGFPTRADELEPIRPDCRRVSAPRADCAILPRRVKPRRKKPANRAGTDDTNAHDLPKLLPRAEASVT